MEEIKIYYSLWRNAIIILIAFAFAIICGFMINDDNNVIIGWIGLFFFGFGGLLMSYMVIKKTILREPVIIITDKSVICNFARQWQVDFVDVDAFFVTIVSKNKMIGIRYKEAVEKEKKRNSNSFVRGVRYFNEEIAGFAEAIPSSGLSVSTEELYDILNERLALFVKSDIK